MKIFRVTSKSELCRYRNLYLIVFVSFCQVSRSLTHRQTVSMEVMARNACNEFDGGGCTG